MLLKCARKELMKCSGRNDEMKKGEPSVARVPRMTGDGRKKRRWYRGISMQFANEKRDGST